MSKDNWVPIGCIAVIIVSAFLLYREFTTKIEYTGVKIGTITFVKKVAQRKYSGEVIWESVEQHAPVYNYDSIRTTADSLSIIRFTDKSQIEVGENTFIYLIWTEKGLTVDFSSGSIAARSTGEGKRALSIVSGTTAVDVGNGDIQIEKKEDTSLVLNVASGTAVVKTNEGESAVTNESSAVIKAGATEIIRKTIVPESPAPGAYFVTFGGEKEIGFAWKAKAGNALRLEVSASDDFKQVRAGVTSATPAARLSLAPGTWYWRLRREDGKETGEARKLEVLRDSRVSLLAPADGQAITRFEQNPIVPFQWTPGELPMGYEVRIASDPGMQKIVKTIASDTTGISTEALGDGTWYWCVTSVYGLTGVAPEQSSPVRSFSIAKEKEMPAPALIGTREEEQVSTLGLRSGGMVLNWEGSDAFASYRIQLAQDRDFRKIVASEETTSNFHRFTPKLAPGTYRMRIVGITPDGRESRPTPARTIVVSPPAKITLLTPADRELIDIREGKPIAFGWRDPNGGAAYLLEVASDRDFRNVIAERKITETAASVPVKSGGTLYWRVSLLDDAGATVAGSAIFSAQTFEALAAPAAIDPGEGQTVDMTDRAKLRFAWKKVDGANRYRIRLFHTDGDTGKLVFQAETAKTAYTFSELNLLDTGSFYWDLQALTYKKDTPVNQSEVRKFNFSITLQEPQQKPELVTPEVIFVQ